MLILNRVDTELMVSIHDDSFPLPNLIDKSYIVQQTIVDQGKVIAIGLVRLTTEGILITDQSLPHSTRARASALLIDSLKQTVKTAGLSECHVFVKESKVQRFLKHLGFNPCKGGTPMVIYF